MHDKWKSSIPAGKIGSAEVVKFTVSERDAAIFNVRASIRSGRYITPGDYTKLLVDGKLMMSDTPAEYRDHRNFIWRAIHKKGDVLINGLGLGCVLACIVDECRSVTVVEKSMDVIDLVWPHFAHHGNASIVHADAYEWKPDKGVRYDLVWHDIWPDICGNNYAGMKRLHRKYGRRSEWQSSWCRAEVMRYSSDPRA